MKELGKIIIGKISESNSSNKLGDVIILPDTQNKSVVYPLDKSIITDEQQNGIKIIPSGNITTEKVDISNVINNLENTTISSVEKNESEILLNNSGNNSSNVYGIGIDDHGKLKGLKDDDHPQYLQKVNAEEIYQKMIFVGPNPPSNPYLNQIWIQTS